ncbi:hypothetical protein HZH68_007448 [Vespula germanica]|uniref:Uncharacterized protein n=1 Tax=Vespula germanica TaxID=30212 RepID=A0A834NBS5_VESGE|nr:hypothetical protein HZH68_007448 [Vespula germanica]
MSKAHVSPSLPHAVDALGEERGIDWKRSLEEARTTAKKRPGDGSRNHTAPTPPSPVPTSSFTERDRGLANRQQRFKIAPCHDEDEVTKLLQREKSVELT